uniref:Uncharacterized protein n=1 Tax=Avena sativa TaxID=4498 RepID=A0ACD5XMQ9_AVESA
MDGSFCCWGQPLVRSMAAALFLPTNPNPTANPTSSLRPPRPSTSGELHFRPRLAPRRARARTHLPAAFGRGSPAAAAAAERGGKDYYATLNIRRDATLKEVKSAYRSLARKYHPDMNKSHGAEEKFKEISAAYEILSDKEKRSMYDRFGETGLHGDYGGGDFGANRVDPYELFNAFFGSADKFFGGMGAGRFHYSSNVNDNRGLDIRYDLLLPFEESILGGKREISIFRHESCGTCHGSGAKSGNSITECTQCRGQGRSMKSQRTPFGIVSQISSCLNCDGSGKIITEHCTRCYGSGKVKVERSIEVDIPGGIEDGSAIRITGGGSVDKQRGVSGDLYIFVRVKEREGIYRDGLSLYSDVTIDYTEAILGTTVKVETIEGWRDLYIPPGIQPGEKLKFAQLGAPDIKRPNHRGDHNFVIKVKIPKNLSDQARSLVEDLAALNGTQDISVSGDDQGNLRKTSHHSSARKKISFWGSVRNLFRADDGDQRFASISAHCVIPRLTSQRGIHPAARLLEGCFMITALIFVMSRMVKFRICPKQYEPATKAKHAEGGV